jgi:hypothetical protein
LAAAEEIAVVPAFVPLTVDDGPRTAPSADIVEVAIGDILIRVGRDVSEEHLARIFRAARAETCRTQRAAASVMAPSVSSPSYELLESWARRASAHIMAP